MLRHLVILTCFLKTLAFSLYEEAKEEFSLSTPEQVAARHFESSSLIGGIISPLSGLPVLKKTDLIAKGAQNVLLNRIYIPLQIPHYSPKEDRNEQKWDRYRLHGYAARYYKGWQFYPHCKLLLNPQTMELLVRDAYGISLNFQLSGPGYSISKLASPPYGLSNLAGDVPSGTHDMRNIKIAFSDEEITLFPPEGGLRKYKRERRSPLQTPYFLEKEILPSGKILKYYYDFQGEPSRIESLDPQERFVYASIEVQTSPDGAGCHFLASTGIKTDYIYERRPLDIKIKEKQEGRKFKGEFKLFSPPILSAVNSPFYLHESLVTSENFLLTSYRGKEDLFSINYSSENYYRADKLFFPDSDEATFKPICGMEYDLPIAGEKEGFTKVNNSDGTSIIYHFSKNLLTTLIQYFDQEGILKKEKVFSWDSENRLTALELHDGSQNLLYRKSYEYDLYGNPTLENFTGDLTGEGNEQTFAIKRHFSEDGRHLLLKEEDEEGKAVCFTYLPHTNLLTSRLIKDHDKIFLRDFFFYDDCNNLIQTISDDGISEDKADLSGVTQRKLTRYKLRQSTPFLHLPEWIEESYWEAGIERTLKKSHLLYDDYGNVAQEKTYDAEGKYAYTIFRSYDQAGNLLSETNALGQKAIYTYNAKGRLETSTNFSGRLHKQFRYDPLGRLLEEKELGDGTLAHITTKRYDLQGRLIEQQDPFQNSTFYNYDPLVNKVSKTVHPPVCIEGQSREVISLATYDPFGRVLTKTDPNGNVTTYRYNAYGSSTEINYPDGAKESYIYTKKGELASYTNPDGLGTLYTYDCLGRILSKTYTFDEKKIAEETFTYSGHHLISETDKEGNTTHYSYDGAGRKVREEFCGRRTDFSYDALGYLKTISKKNGDNTLLIHYTRDFEGNILQKYKTDTKGNLLYKISFTYDGDGNQKTITRYIDGKESTESFTYDPFHRLIRHVDAQGYVTKTLYSEDFQNALGQKVLQRLAIDPLNTTHVETFDAHSRVIKKEILNPHHAVISSQEFIYDPCGNLLFHKDHIYENTTYKNTHILSYAYTPTNHLATLTRAFATPLARTTALSYLPSGKLASKTLPDTTILSYTYHPLGFLARLDSSDGQIRHSFTYNNLGHLLSALDENHFIAITRQLDPFGNTTHETFPSGLRVQKTYDGLGRLTSLSINDVDQIHYIYDSLFLRKIERLSEDEVLYEHIYREYDLSGNLISENLIDSVGQVSHSLDSKGQKISISSPYFNQNCKYDPIGNLVTIQENHTGHHYTYDRLSQLTSEQGNVYAYDSQYNRIRKNNNAQEVTSLNELPSCAYDLNGNRMQSDDLKFAFDPLGRLIETTSEKYSIHFTYDPLGRRLSKKSENLSTHKITEENYLYDGQNEIGAFTSEGISKNLRILGLANQTIAIEAESKIFAVLTDVQGNIRSLIDIHTKAPAANYHFTAFGEQFSNSYLSPWSFASKRFDPETGLIYFGKRYYDSHLAHWLTPDPLGPHDSANPYQYVFNNPFRFKDPDGQFIQFALPLLIWGAEATLPALSACAAPLIYGALTGAIAYGGYKAVQTLNNLDYNGGLSSLNYSIGLVALDRPYKKWLSQQRPIAAQNKLKEQIEKKQNTNPFEGPVDEDIFIVDSKGNVIKIPQDHQVEGSKDGTWIQVKDKDKKETGIRKDGGHPPGPKHKDDPRSWAPHAHVPDITNPDGTPWLPIY